MGKTWVVIFGLYFIKNSWAGIHKPSSLCNSDGGHNNPRHNGSYIHNNEERFKPIIDICMGSISRAANYNLQRTIRCLRGFFLCNIYSPIFRLCIENYKWAKKSSSI